MTDTGYALVFSITTLASMAILAFVGLKGWRDWIDLKRDELQSVHASFDRRPAPDVADRIDIADLKERLRKLEAIAAGVDL